MTTEHDKVAEAIADVLRRGIAHIKGRGKLLNEATTQSTLIWPVLEALGYPPTHRIPEYGASGDRPDELLYLNPVTSTPGQAALVVEAKQYGTEFDHTPRGASRFGSPDRQLQRYLRQHIACGPDTIGVLTDGVKWRIYRRTGEQSNPDIEFIDEFNFQLLGEGDRGAPLLLKPDPVEQLHSLIGWLSRQNIASRSVLSLITPTANLADDLFEAIYEDAEPENILRKLLAQEDIIIQTDISEDVRLTGVREDASKNDWIGYTYTKAIPVKSKKPFSDGKNAVVAAVQLTYAQDRGLTRPDVALCARTFASADEAGAALVVAYTVAPLGNVDIRIAVCANNRVNMTAQFELRLPSPSARSAIDKMLRLIRAPGRELTHDELLEPLEAAPLRYTFYKEISKWTWRMQKGKELPERRAILRHLIRVLFTWILKEEGIIPSQPFERAFVSQNLDDMERYHEEVLSFLFHERLNIPDLVRTHHQSPFIDQVMNSAPFLNGSIFAVHDDDDLLHISANGYWNTDEDAAGLFTILARYHWTMDEHRPGESEQTLDPELLSNLFERLITPTQEGTQPPLRQPQGTYYTPADIADEMVKDALTAAVEDQTPRNISEDTMRELFGNQDSQLPQLSPRQRDTLTRRIKQLRVFDPAVGSGEFLFSALIALQTALHKLEPDKKKDSATDIIQRQLAGQDINHLAVQITRLRLFIAITAQHKRMPTQQQPPLPNLEARIVCADTLQTIADQEWRPDHPGQFDSADPKLIAKLTQAAEIRARWFEAHTESDKQTLLHDDAETRDHLKLMLQQKGPLATQELIRFAEAPLFSTASTPARTDARLLFYENPWRGFDIVISNPPYENLFRTMDAKERQRLAEEKRYKTVKVNDLYSLFCEAALAVASPEGGVVTMIVPLSIAFGQRQRTLRKIFDKRSKQINLRHYNNRPDTPFNASPTVRTPNNNQRATVISATLGQSTDPIIRSSGLQRWPTEERKSCISRRGTTLIPRFSEAIDARISTQWPRIPSTQIAAMIEAIISHKKNIGSYESDDGVNLALPRTAGYYISSIPQGTANPRSEHLITVPDGDTMRLLIATLNGHVAYAWWLIFGDSFHINLHEFRSMTIPDAWGENPQHAIDMGQRLLEAVPSCGVSVKKMGKMWRNVNFHLKPDLIDELDRLHIAALGLPVEPLLSHLQIMRSNSSWNYDIR